MKLLAAGEETSAGAGNGAEDSAGEKFSAIYTYVAQYEDELSFEAGDVVMVQAKDEADWWRGECRGKTGVFPSNYVEPLKCESTSMIIFPSRPSLVLLPPSSRHD